MDGWGWIASIAAGIAAAWTARRVFFVPQAVTWSGQAPDDAEFLARIVVFEAASADPLEWSGIMWVALNRAARDRAAVRDIVATTAWFGGGERGRAAVEAVQAPGGRGYRSPTGRRAPPDSSSWNAALTHAHKILNGQEGNPIGRRTHFVHPAGLPRCELPAGTPTSDGRICVEGHALPTWAVSRELGGRAEFAPIKVGRAVFS